MTPLLAFVIPSLHDFLIAILILVVLAVVYAYLIEPNVPEGMFKKCLRLLVGLALAIGVLRFFGLL